MANKAIQELESMKCEGASPYHEETLKCVHTFDARLQQAKTSMKKSGAKTPIKDETKSKLERLGKARSDKLMAIVKQSVGNIIFDSLTNLVHLQTLNPTSLAQLITPLEGIESKWHAGFTKVIANLKSEYSKVIGIAEDLKHIMLTIGKKEPDMNSVRIALGYSWKEAKWLVQLYNPTHEEKFTELQDGVEERLRNSSMTYLAISRDQYQKCMDDHLSGSSACTQQRLEATTSLVQQFNEFITIMTQKYGLLEKDGSEIHSVHIDVVEAFGLLHYGKVAPSLSINEIKSVKAACQKMGEWLKNEDDCSLYDFALGLWASD